MTKLTADDLDDAIHDRETAALLAHLEGAPPPADPARQLAAGAPRALASQPQPERPPDMNAIEAIDYLKTMPGDEPVFVLRAQDKSAVATVQAWIYKAAERLGWNHEKIRGAEEVVSAMNAWPVKKHAD
jgi:hypothetical protein